MSLTESIVEAATLEWFGEPGYAVSHGPQLAPGEPATERDSFGQVVLPGRLRESIWWLNTCIPEEACEGCGCVRCRKSVRRHSRRRTAPLPDAAEASI